MFHCSLHVSVVV